MEYVFAVAILFSVLVTVASLVIFFAAWTLFWAHVIVVCLFVFVFVLCVDYYLSLTGEKKIRKEK
jgi:hypothetical protein